MSIEAYTAAWNTPITGGQKLTLLALADFASAENGYTCYASIDTLAMMIGTERRQIQRNLAELAKTKYIKIGVCRGRGNTNVYDLTPIMATQNTSSKTGFNGQKHVIQDAKHVMDDTFADDKTRHPGQENTSSRTQNTSWMTQKGVMDDTQSIKKPIEPLREPKEEESPYPLNGRFRPSPVQSAIKPPIEELVDAILEVCNLRRAIPAHLAKAESAASQIPTFEADYILARYAHGGSGAWNWYTHDFRGLKGSPPIPSQVVDTITTTAVAPPPANGHTRNGKQPQPDWTQTIVSNGRGW